MKRILKQARSLLSPLSRQDGLAYIEFALSLSFLLFMFLGSVEVSRYILTIQKLEKTVETVANVTTQADPNSSPLTVTQMQQLMSAVQDMMSPYSFNSNGLVIVTDVTKTGSNSPVVNWQYCGGGTMTQASGIGNTIGGNATLPSGFAMTSGEEVVIAEIFYNYQPVVTSQWSVIAATKIYRTAVFMPRLGVLTGFSSHC